MIHSKSILGENLLQYGCDLCTPLPQPFLSLLGLGPLENILRTICNVPKSPNEHLKKILKLKKHSTIYFEILQNFNQNLPCMCPQSRHGMHMELALLAEPVWFHYSKQELTLFSY
jgi:hypothetical protein